MKKAVGNVGRQIRPMRTRKPLTPTKPAQQSTPSQSSSSAPSMASGLSTATVSTPPVTPSSGASAATVGRPIDAVGAGSNSKEKILTYKFPKNQNVEFMASKVPSIYIPSVLDPDIDLTPYRKPFIDLFSRTDAKYVSPAEFNYEPPTGSVPELAFVGRSNVGKSSLIKALLGDRKKIVRVSSEPGCTTSVNYYSLYKPPSSPQLYLVDLPGYGFAKVAKTVRDSWRKTIFGFLQSRERTILRRTYVLIDSRHGLKDTDIEMMKILSQCMIAFQIVVTKCDLSSQKELNKSLQGVFNTLMTTMGMNPSLPYVHTVSAHTGFGIENLQLSMAEVVSQKWGDPKKPPSQEKIMEMAREAQEAGKGRNATARGTAVTGDMLEAEGIELTPEMKAFARKWEMGVANRGQPAAPLMTPGMGVVAPEK